LRDPPSLLLFIPTLLNAGALLPASLRDVIAHSPDSRMAAVLALPGRMRRTADGHLPSAILAVLISVTCAALC